MQLFAGTPTPSRYFSTTSRYFPIPFRYFPTPSRYYSTPSRYFPTPSIYFPTPFRYFPLENFQHIPDIFLHLPDTFQRAQNQTRSISKQLPLGSVRTLRFLSVLRATSKYFEILFLHFKVILGTFNFVNFTHSQVLCGAFQPSFVS